MPVHISSNNEYFRSALYEMQPGGQTRMFLLFQLRHCILVKCKYYKTFFIVSIVLSDRM